MTDISVTLDGDIAVAIEAQGHSGFADKGEDIVCAGVSALLQALLYGFKNVLDLSSFFYTIEEGEGRMTIDWSMSRSPEASLLADTIIGSLKEIARAYPEHVRIMEVHTDGIQV